MLKMLESLTDFILNNTWESRDGVVIPSAEDVKLAGGAVKLEATMLYADLANSTDLAVNFDKRIAARTFKTFLMVSSRIIKNNGGAIRSFDGDRVMGVFVGAMKNSNAAKASLKINYAMKNVIRPKIENKYPVLIERGFALSHAVGIDTSEVMVVRAGVHGDNDLVWVGRAPNVAAKLSGLRDEGYASYITANVFDNLDNELKFHEGRSMWEQGNLNNMPGISRIYRSFWTWVP